MNVISCFFLIAVIFMIMGCVTPAQSPAAPIGNGYLNLCVSDPSQAVYWQQTDEILWNVPGGVAEENSTIISRIPSCDNSAATIWETRLIGDNVWNRISLHAKDGSAEDGWLPASHLIGMTNETGTEWSNNYSSITGRWDQTERGNGAKIWYEFTSDEAYTLNYDSRGNKEIILDRGSWAYIGNSTYDLISALYGDHRHIPINIDQVTKSFKNGVEYSSESEVGRETVFARE